MTAHHHPMLCMIALGFSFVGCAATNTYTYKAPAKQEKQLAPVQTRVVTAAEIQGKQLRRERLAFPFGTDQDGAKLVADFLDQAEKRRAPYVADLALYLQTVTDSQLVECRSDIVPETVTESTWKPATTVAVSVQKPVTRNVTEQQYRCKQVNQLESRPYTEQERKCEIVRHPVQRTRTTYRSSYNSLTHSMQSSPQTEYYTDYETRNECRTVPVSRTRLETVHKTHCGLEPVNHLVTRYEFQFENRYVPGHFENLTRQRLKELEPQCYRVDSAPVGSPQPVRTAAIEPGKVEMTRQSGAAEAPQASNRIEGWLLFE